MHISLPEKLDQDLLDILSQKPFPSQALRVIVRAEPGHLDQVSALVSSMGQVLRTLPRAHALSAFLSPDGIATLVSSSQVRGVEADSIHSIA